MASNLLSVLGASPARRYYHVMPRAAARWSDTPSAGSMHISHERRIKARGNYESSGKAQLGGRSSLVLVEMVMRARRNVEALDKECIMLMTLFVILLVMWLLGMVSSYTLGGFIHILLLVALVVVVIRIIEGRQPL